MEAVAATVWICQVFDMATVRVTHRLHPIAIARVLTGRGVGNNMFIRGLKVETRAKVEISRNPKRVDTGRLRASIQTSRIRSFGLPGARVGSKVKYARWVQDGTGIYGPRHRRITPTTKSVLRFVPKGGNSYVYAKSVAGMRPNPYLRKALPAARL